MFHDNIQEYVSQAAAANFNQANSGYRPPYGLKSIRTPGFSSNFRFLLQIDLSLYELKPTCMSLELADSVQSLPNPIIARGLSFSDFGSIQKSFSVALNHIVANSSPTLTPFEKMSFYCSRKANAFLALDDVTNSTEGWAVLGPTVMKNLSAIQLCLANDDEAESNYTTTGKGNVSVE
ncbi:hypothetical protein Tco_0260902 [Tanacetum coccineum]